MSYSASMPPRVDLSAATALLRTNPTWSNARIAKEAGCSPATIHRLRVKLGIPSGFKLPWLHGQSA